MAFTENGYKVQQDNNLINLSTQYLSIKGVNNISNAFVLPPFYYSTGQMNTTPQSTNGAQINHDYADYTIELFNESELRIIREATDSDIWVSWQVLEALNKEFTIYRGSYDATNSGNDFYIPIGSTVNQTTSMAIITGHHSNVANKNLYDRFLMRSYVYNETHIRVRRGDGAASDVQISWVVVEWDPNKIASFQTGTTFVDGGVHTEANHATSTLSTKINKNCSFMYFQIDTTDGGLDQVSVTGLIFNDTQVDFYPSSCGTTGDTTVDRNVRWYVIDFGSSCGFRDQGQIDYASDANWYNHTETLSQSITLNRSIIFTSETHDGAGTAFPRPFPNALLRNESTLELFRTYFGQEAYIEWQLLELPYTYFDFKWNQSLLDLGTDFLINGNISSSANISSNKNQSNLTITCFGNCSIIKTDFINGTDIFENQTKQINFTCINSSKGIFNADLFVISNEDSDPEIINVTCEFTGANVVFWNQSTLDLGEGNYTFGNISNIITVNSTNLNSEINVSCVSGNCLTFSHNWTNDTSMINGESIEIKFECNDSIKGSFSADFEILSIQDQIPNTVTVTCQMNDIIPPGTINNLTKQFASYTWIYWNWTNPNDTDFNHVEIWLNGSFISNTSNNFFNITYLKPSTNYEIQIRTVDDDANINTSWVNNVSQTLIDNYPSIILYSPINDSTEKEEWRILNLTVFDDLSNQMCVEIYGREIIYPNINFLLYQNCSFNNNSIINYNMTSIPLQSDTNTEILWHFNNQSIYGENDNLVVNFVNSTTNHNRTCAGNCPIYAPNSGKFAGCYDYDGASQYWLLDEQYFNDIFSVKSFQAWIKPDNLVGIQTIFEEGGGTNGWGIRLNDSRLEFATRSGGAGTQTTISTQYTDTINWHFISTQFNNNNLTLYLDGTLVATDIAAYASIATHGNDGGLGATYGSDAFGTAATGNYYDGKIDEVRILNYARTDEQIKNDANLTYNNLYYWYANATDSYWESKSEIYNFLINAGNITWNKTILNLGIEEPSFGNLTGNVTINSIAIHTNITVTCDSGNCSKITHNFINGTTLINKESKLVKFECSNDTTGVFNAVFNLFSNEDQTPNQITVQCEYLPNITVIWNQSTLNLGIGKEKEGNLSGYVNITSKNNNNNVTVTCSSGNCSKITANWTNGTNMIDSQTHQVKFVCNDSEWGTYNSIFDVISDEDKTPNQILVECIFTNPPPSTITNLSNQSRGYTWIYWNWTNPTDYDFDHVEIWINGTFITNTSNNYYNTTGLMASTIYDIRTRTTDTFGVINTTWINDQAQTLQNSLVNITLNSPPNGSTNFSLWRLLNFTVSDIESNTLCVEIFGRESATPTDKFLLFQNCSMQNNSIITYNWSNPILQTKTNTEIIWHFDNQTQYNENETFVYNYAGSAQNHDRTCLANCPIFISGNGKFGGGFSYNGINQYWLLDEQYFNDAFSEKSIQLWIKPNTLVGVQTIYEEGGGTNGAGIRLNGNQLEFSVRNGGAGTQTTISTLYTDTIKWHFISAQFNNSNMTLYVDGELKNKTSAAYNTISAHTNEGGLGATEGGDSMGGGGYFSGLIDEVRILNTIRTPDQIKKDYNLTFGSTYYWFVNVTDDYSKTNGPVWKFTISDNTPPKWDPLPTNIQVYYEKDLFYDANATDDNKIDSYFIDDTVNFKINASNGFLENNTKLQVGIYQLNISVNDTSGNLNWTIINITVINTYPIVYINKTLNNTFTKDKKPQIDFNFSSILYNYINCSLYFNNTPYNITESLNNTQTFLFSNTTLPDSSYSVYINCTDPNNRSGISNIINLYIDSTPPRVLNLTPFNNTNINTSQSINITANITDMFNIDKVIANITWQYGNVLQQMFDLDSDNVYGTEFFNTFSLGRYNITILANDSINNINNSESTFFLVSFYTDIWAPIVTINQSLNHLITKITKPQIDFNFSDNISNTADCTLFFNNTPSNTTLNIINNTKSILTVNSSLSDGNYSVFINCTDKNNNVGQSTIINIGIDNTPPSVYNITPINKSYNASDLIDINANVSDNINLKVVYANISWGTFYNIIKLEDANSDGIYNYTFSNTSDLGRYDITIIANDSVDLQNVSETAFFNITDQINPTIILGKPDNNNFTTNNLITFFYTPNDNHIIQNCSLYLNNNKNLTNTSVTKGVINNFTISIPDGVYNWSIRCTDFSGNTFLTTNKNLKINYNIINISVFNSTFNLSSNSTIYIYNSTNDMIAKNNKTISLLTHYNELYDVEIRSSLIQGLLKVRLFNVNFSKDANITSQIVNSLSSLPATITNITYIFALNDSDLNYDYARLDIPKNGISEINTIIHCLSWSYQYSNCSYWEVNDSLDYNMQENSTTIWFNASGFDAFGGGGGSTLANLTNITIYDVTSQSDKHSSGTEIDYGLNKTFNLETNKEYRIKFTIRNDGNQWNIDPADLIYHTNLNSSWTINTTNDIWYYTITDNQNFTSGNFSNGKIIWNQSQGGRIAKNSYGYFYYIINITKNTNGSYGVYFLINDTSKNSGSYDYSEFNITTKDYDNPIVSINLSLNNSITTDPTPDINFNFTDTMSNTADCTLFFNNVPYNTTLGFSNNTNSILTVNSTLADANYSVYINCTDQSFNIGTSNKIFIAVDTKPPKIVNITPLPGTEFNLSDAVNITANITDEIGIKNVFANITWNGGSALQQMFDLNSDNIFDTEFINTLIIGRYNITIIVNDTIDHINNSETSWFNITQINDLIPPNVNINLSLNNSLTNSNKPFVDFNFTDENSTTANCTLFFDNTPYNQSYNLLNNTQYIIQPNSTLVDSNYTVYINCTDQSNNTGKSETIFIRIDTTAPNVTNPAPQESFEVFSIINITVNIKDSLAVSNVFANITWSGGNIIKLMTDENYDNIYNLTFSNTTSVGMYNVTFFAYDTAGNLNNTVWTNFSIYSKSSLNLLTVTPINKSGDNDGIIIFNYNITSKYNISNCSLIINNSIQLTNSTINKNLDQSFVIKTLNYGFYNWEIVCTDNYNKTNTTNPRQISIIPTTQFSGLTTDFTSLQVDNISNLILETAYGMLNFTTPVNLESGPNIDSYVQINQNFADINSIFIPILNTTADITLYNLNYEQDPIILLDGLVCPPSICTQLDYSNNKLKFNVTHFTSYSSSANSNLIIFDSTDPEKNNQTIYTNETMGFYANYSNITTGASIVGGGSFCNISLYFHNGTSNNIMMQYNFSSQLYEYSNIFIYNGIYNWSVFCNGSSANYEPLTVYDNFLITRKTGMKSGYCTLEYIKKGPKFIEGYINDGDKVRMYCEPGYEISENEDFSVKVIPEKGLSDQKYINAPDIITEGSGVLYP